jgi:dTDP-4-dehydrorhamnose 3,5-epimerase
MNIIQTDFPGLLVVEPVVFGDSRGYFFESYNEIGMLAAGIDTVFRQDNESSSRYGVIRGLHFQRPPHTQAKLIRVVEGAICDVAVDMRKGSPTYAKWFGIELSAENKKQLYIPEGFAHGFSVLSERTVILYKCDKFYHPQSEGGVAYNDPQLNIDWKINTAEAILSEKDKKLPLLSEINTDFVFA